MKFDEAMKLAHGIRTALLPYCERIEIAGSVRRGKAEVHDFELCAIPKMIGEPVLFGQMPKVSALDCQGAYFSGLGQIVKNGSRYKQILLMPQNFMLDLYIVLPPANWGVIFTIRTGPADFSHWCVTQRKKGGGLPSNCQVKDGAVIRNGVVVPMPEEMDFLNFLGLGWVEPADREAKWGGSD